MAEVREIPVDSIHPNPNQPRKVFDEAALRDLAESIANGGLLQAICVRPDAPTLAGPSYMIVAGERRWRAHRLLGRPRIAATIVDMTDDELADAAIVENLQRRDITPLEEARAFKARLDAGLTVEELARRLGLKQPWRITERTSLLRLTPEGQEALARGILTPAQAYEMSRLAPAGQRVLFDAIGAAQCPTYRDLRRVTEGLLQAEAQVDMFAPPTPPTEAEKSRARQLEVAIQKASAALSRGFDGNDVVILRKVNPASAAVLADQLDLIEKAARRLRSEVLAATVAAKLQEASPCLD